MKVSKQLMVVTGGILTLGVVATVIGFQIPMERTEASLNHLNVGVTETPVKEESDIIVEMMAPTQKEIKKQGEKYQYILIEDEGDLPPGEKDLTADEALDLTMSTLNQLYDFNYDNQVITVEYRTIIFVSDDTAVDTYHVTVNGPVKGDANLDGYICKINSITGEIINVQKYIYNERVDEYNYRETEEGYIVNNKTKEAAKSVALELLEKYNIYDKDKVKITDVNFNEYDVRGYSVSFKTDKENTIIVEVAQKSQDLMGYWVFPKEV